MKFGGGKVTRDIVSLKLFADDISLTAQGAIFKQQHDIDTDKICSECANTLKSVVNEWAIIVLTTNTTSDNTSYLAAVIKYCEKNSIDLVLFNDEPEPRILVKAAN